MAKGPKPKSKQITGWTPRPLQEFIEDAEASDLCDDLMHRDCVEEKRCLRVFSFQPKADFRKCRRVTIIAREK